MNKLLAISIASASIAIGAIPSNAQVDPAIHELCADVKDYAGCVKTQNSFKAKTQSEDTKTSTEASDNNSPWQQHLSQNPELREWVKANPTLGEKAKAKWLKENSSENGCPNGHYFHSREVGCVFNNTAFFEADCEQRGWTWDPTGAKCLLPRYTETISEQFAEPASTLCPPGKEFYRTNGFFGIGKRDLGCMTPYEAESLHIRRQDSIRNSLGTFNQIQPKNCTTNFIGNTAYTNCY